MKKEDPIGIDEFHKALPFEFSDLELLRMVFVHRSFLNEKEAVRLKYRESNERLEFLGDAVLSNTVSHMLYQKYPGLDEGELTRLRAKLVNKHTLARLAKSLCLHEHLLLGKGERAAGRENPTILAGAFEAFLAAIYLDLGFRKAFSYIEKVFSHMIDETLMDHGHFDSKPRLQEAAQRIFKEGPIYRLIKEDGPPHKKLFEIEVIVGGQVLGAGKAHKKKDAEQHAALEALNKLRELYSEHFAVPEKA